ncbi:unnamed protein product [Prorocentrum cordatum]|uniref:Uncharacterized protein n=1 Tax=Prorocentrum cordatum TaxID=2364126 RepID=A0ABN9TDL5_9DINO|nr:unnamed protein product [Polarella glacialis]
MAPTTQSGAPARRSWPPRLRRPRAPALGARAPDAPGPEAAGGGIEGGTLRILQISVRATNQPEPWIPSPSVLLQAGASCEARVPRRWATTPSVVEALQRPARRALGRAARRGRPGRAVDDPAGRPAETGRRPSPHGEQAPSPADRRAPRAVAGAGRAS